MHAAAQITDLIELGQKHPDRFSQGLSARSRSVCIVGWLARSLRYVRIGLIAIAAQHHQMVM